MLCSPISKGKHQRNDNEPSKQREKVKWVPCTKPLAEEAAKRSRGEKLGRRENMKRRIRTTPFTPGENAMYAAHG
jgi:hypothetical protein